MCFCLSISAIIIYCLICFIHCLFTVNRVITGRDTNQSNLLHVPKCAFNVHRRTILLSRLSLHNFVRQNKLYLSVSICISLILQMQFDAISKLVLFTSQYSLLIYSPDHILREVDLVFLGSHLFSMRLQEMLRVVLMGMNYSMLCFHFTRCTLH